MKLIWWNLISSNPNEHHDPKVPLDDFKNILEQTVQTAIENSITPVLVTSTPLVTKWWFDYICIGQNREALLKFINNDPEVLFKNQEQYSNTVKEFATKNNIQLIENNNIDLKVMMNYPVFLVNDSEKNMELISKLECVGANVKNVLEHVANILVIKPNVVFNNINTLSFYGVKLTDDNNNNGYIIIN